MEKNENGFPCSRENNFYAAARCLNCLCNSGGGDTGENNHTCGGDGSCLDQAPLAYVYAPNQVFRLLYSANDALKHGTLFEELYKPMEVYGRE